MIKGFQIIQLRSILFESDTINYGMILGKSTVYQSYNKLPSHPQVLLPMPWQQKKNIARLFFPNRKRKAKANFLSLYIPSQLPVGHRVASAE